MRNALWFGSIWAVWGLVLPGCGDEAGDGTSGAGGAEVAGGSGGNPQKHTTGGDGPSAAGASSGGSTSGGQHTSGATGGHDLGTNGGSATGGRSATGGLSATGGRASTGGRSATGGRASTGGRSATGGQSPTGGGGTGGQPPRPPAPGGLCTRCVDDADCSEAGSRCIELYATTAMGERQTFGERVCGRDCASAQCPTGYDCRALSGGGKQCFPSTNTCATGGGLIYGGYPRVIYVEYATGASTPAVCAQMLGAAPAYSCKYGASVAECQRLLHAELSRIFAAFNLDIVFEKPARVPYYHAFVASASPMAGWSRFADCKDRYVRTDAVECMYGGGRFLKADATGIAHEVGHTMGLDHVEATTDIMHGSLGTLVNGTAFELNSDRFEDIAHPEGFCAPTQNSYRRILELVGPRR